MSTPTKVFLSAIAFMMCGIVYADTIELFGTVRDFQDTHPDSESSVGGNWDPDIVDTALGIDGKPVYVGGGLKALPPVEQTSTNGIMIR